jgi:hypothetical protein
MVKLQGTLAHCLTANIDAACGKHFFKDAQGKWKAKVQPHRIADQLKRETIAHVGNWNRC